MWALAGPDGQLRRLHMSAYGHCIGFSADGLADFGLLEVADWRKIRERQKKKQLLCVC